MTRRRHERPRIVDCKKSFRHYSDRCDFLISLGLAEIDATRLMRSWFPVVEPHPPDQADNMALWPFGRKDPSTSLSPEVQRIFEKVHRFLDDEAAQNNALPEDFRRTLTESPSCDRIPNAFGEFGRIPTNPIPVNGPVGELIYLSRLETSDGVAIAFHRLGALDEVDVFEVVSEDGRHWDVLYLSLYFPRKSKHVPSGYRIMTDEARRRALFRGTILRVDGFPKGIYSAAMECTKRLIGMPLGDSRLKGIEARNNLIRPRKHLEGLSQLKFTGRTNAPPDQRAKKDQDAQKEMPERSAQDQKATHPAVKDLLIASAPPWDRVPPMVIAEIVKSITDKGLLEAFVLQSMKAGLVAKYETVDSDDGPIIRAQISHILCQAGNRAVPMLADALKAGQRDVALKALALAGDTFEAAIALSPNQTVAHIGLAEIYSLCGKTAEAQKWAKLGLVELEKTRATPAGQTIRYSNVFPADMLDQLERQLRSYLVAAP